jgi:hypothetical protein
MWRSNVGQKGGRGLQLLERAQITLFEDFETQPPPTLYVENSKNENYRKRCIGRESNPGLAETVL